MGPQCEPNGGCILCIRMVMQHYRIQKMLRIWSPRTHVDLCKLLATKRICWAQATNQSFCQRTQLNERYDTSLHSLERYATLSFHPPYFRRKRNDTRKNDGENSAGNLQTICRIKNFSPRYGHLHAPRNFCHSRNIVGFAGQCSIGPSYIGKQAIWRQGLKICGKAKKFS